MQKPYSSTTEYNYLFVITPLLIEINDSKKFSEKKCFKKNIFILEKNRGYNPSKQKLLHTWLPFYKKHFGVGFTKKI